MADLNTPTTRTYTAPFTGFASIMQAVLRIGAGLLFMQHGAQKLFGLFGGVDGAGATVPLMSQMGLAGVLEFFGGLLVVIGLLTRPVSAILTVLMLAAFFIAHLPKSILPVLSGGDLALLFALVFAFFTAAGAGPLSVDNAIKRR